jgi:hypothetical protein
MSFFHKKMSQNLWPTIMPFGPVTLIFYWPKNFFSGQTKAGLISGTDFLAIICHISELFPTFFFDWVWSFWKIKKIVNYSSGYGGDHEKY